MSCARCSRCATTSPEIPAPTTAILISTINPQQRDVTASTMEDALKQTGRIADLDGDCRPYLLAPCTTRGASRAPVAHTVSTGSPVRIGSPVGIGTLGRERSSSAVITAASAKIAADHVKAVV